MTQSRPGAAGVSLRDQDTLAEDVVIDAAPGALADVTIDDGRIRAVGFP
jgi:hypothetical protein